MTSFQSVLFEHPEPGPAPDRAAAPDYFGDLHLDQVLDALTEGREQYELAPFFHAPLHDADAVHYRHEVLRDLERPEVHEVVVAFARAMQTMRDHLATVDKLHYRLQKESWFVDAVAVYCDAVEALARGLAGSGPESRALRGLADHVAAYLESDAFTSLRSEAGAVRQAFAEIHYEVRINGARVTVGDYEGEPDYGAEVEETFARFQQGTVGDYLMKLHDLADMNHVEAQILGCVERMHPEPFARRSELRARRGGYLEETIARFDREVQLYLAYLELVGRMREAGLSLCYPEVSADSKETAVEETFDLALARKLVAAGETVVTNELHLRDPERIFVVSGPNNGGKTTFARMLGQLHHLAGLGLLVPGGSARLFLPDRIYTHFEREEDIETLRGKFEDELVRVHDILERATTRSLIVMNESFGSTSLDDARLVGTEVMRRILDLGALGVYVTFIDEIATLSATVSMVSQIVPEDPAQRTFKVIRRPADGRAYAWAIAEKYGLTYDRLIERVAA
ncbi:MAG TPA: hypothetical protein VHB30_11045 [Solirubrobacteraceae bacterium]|jgi:hypothetical protein|nr:hypothetical protein [Solirubrobacteraceae bacterium]